MFSQSLFTKQQMELVSDHSTKSLIEILREAAASANRHRPASKLGPLSGPEIPRFRKSDFTKLGGFAPDDERLNAAVSRAGFGPGGPRGSPLLRLFQFKASEPWVHSRCPSGPTHRGPRICHREYRRSRRWSGRRENHCLRQYNARRACYSHWRFLRGAARLRSSREPKQELRARLWRSVQPPEV